MRRAIFAIAFTLLAAGTAPASPPGVMATVHQFIDGLNKGDMKTGLAACAARSSIIDDFPPHTWQGAGACAAWARDFDADSKKRGITQPVVTLGTPKHLLVTGDRAYVVVPADYAYKLHGKPVDETTNTLTAALQRVAGHWRITAWAWSKQ
ncbi:MAG: hypothetical protein M3126_12545 [Candidatus Eremiobacteraeota bacterium]|nr:hypothetical protein [Candidatus Eremiobacteraeota bacterium]